MVHGIAPDHAPPRRWSLAGNGLSLCLRSGGEYVKRDGVSESTQHATRWVSGQLKRIID